MPDETADRLIGQLEREAELVDHGAFTIDDAAAQAKLARYRMAEPEAWACLIVEAASLLGARRISFESSLDSMRASFDGRPLAPDELFSRAAGAGIRPERKLAIAFHTLFDALGVGTILVESGGVRVRLQPGGAVERSASGGERTTITVLGLSGTAREQALLVERCRYSPLRVRLDHVDISHGLLAALQDRDVHTYAPLHDDAGEVYGYVGAGPRSPTLVLLTHGVLAETPPCGGYAVVDVSLAKDIGEREVLHDAAFAKLLARIEAGVQALPTQGIPLPPREPVSYSVPKAYQRLNTADATFMRLLVLFVVLLILFAMMFA